MLVALEDGHSESDPSPRDSSFGIDGEGEQVWRHPSELGAMMAAANGIAPPPPRPNHRKLRMATLGVTLGLIGLTIISLSQPGPNNSATRTAGAPIVQRAGLPLPAEVVPAIAETATVTGEVRIERWADAEVATGGGVLIFDDGYIATSRDFIAGASTISVVLPTGERYEGRLVGADYIIDIAVVKIDATMPAAPMADKVPGRGDDVMVADPWSAEPQKNRLINVDKVMADRYGIYRQELLQFEDPADTTAEGAPLLNNNDEVVGLIVPVDSPTALNYALDIRAVRTAAYQIIETGFVDHVAWLGIKGVDANGEGVEVRDVAVGSPAHQVGIEVGDIISSLARRRVASMDDLHRALQTVDPGDEAIVLFERNGRLQDKVAELGIRANVTNRD